MVTKISFRVSPNRTDDIDPINGVVMALKVALLSVTLVSLSNTPFLRPTYQTLVSKGEALNAEGSDVKSESVKLPLDPLTTFIDLIAF